ncbi:MAG: outer membrane beta-barrel protein [Bacteroidetes bacterium]|jgi:opacity protein-like surface antigen/DNA-binding protein Fis|nr:outer membrane beta-barrel protein [Bacteroidota bacterium]
MNRSIHFMNFARRAGLAVLMTFFTSAVYAQVTGLNYSFSPTAERLIWSDNSGLSNGYIYGGKIGVGFGQYIELEGIYQFGRDFKTAPHRISQDPDFSEQFSELSIRDLAINKYGLNTKLNLTSRTMVPYVNIGVGVLEFKQDNLINNRQLYYTGGAGLMTTIASRYSIFAEVNKTGYRLNLGNLYSEDELTNVGVAPESLNELLNHSWNVKVGLKAYLGGSRYDDPSQTSFVFLDKYNGGLYNTRINITPVYGQIYFNESLGMPKNQQFAGLSAGFEFGPHVALQGFYWRGLNGENLKFEGISMYGAEFKSSLLRSNITPYVTLGAGYLSLDEDYRTDNLPQISNQVFGLAGLGADFHVSKRVTIDAAVRTMMNSLENPEPDTWLQNLEFSPVLTAGVTIKIGSISNKRASQKRQQMTIVSEGPRIEPETETEPQTTTREPEVVRAETEPQPEAKTEQTTPKTETKPAGEIRAVDQKETERTGTIVSDLSPEIQLVVMREALLTEQIASAVADGDSAKAEFLKSEREELRSQLMTVGFKKLKEEEEADVLPAPVLDTRTFTLPVLEEGEIYIRFGKPEPRQQRPQQVVSEPSQATGDESNRTQDLENSVNRLLDEYLEREGSQTVSDTADTQLMDMEARLNRLMEALENTPESNQNIDARLESFEQKVLELLEAQSAQTQSQQPSTQESQEYLDARLNEFEKRMMNILERQRPAVQQDQIIRERQTTSSSTITRDTQGRELQGLGVYTGISNPLQMIIGVRADYGTILGDRLQILPEFVFGFGSSTTMYNINMNMHYNLDFARFGESFVPYAGIGAGILAFSNPPSDFNGIQLTGSIFLGTEYQLSTGALFVDYTNYNLFKVNRLQVGYRFYF